MDEYIDELNYVNSNLSLLTWGSIALAFLFFFFSAMAYYGLSTISNRLFDLLITLAPRSGFRTPFQISISGSVEWSILWFILGFVCLDSCLFFRVCRSSNSFAQFLFPLKAIRQPKLFAGMVFGHLFLILLFLILAGGLVALTSPNKSFKPTRPQAGRAA